MRYLVLYALIIEIHMALLQVVELIRSTKNIGPDAELALTVRPNGNSFL